MVFPLDSCQYELLSRIGRGITADVFAAQCKTNGKIIAIKSIDLENADVEIESLRREVAFWANAHHPNVVSYYGSVVDGPVVYLLMELCSAGSLSNLIRRLYPTGITDETVIARILYDVLNACSYFHSHHQLHRDIKPGNILLCRDGVAKIGDLGIAASLIESGKRKRARFTITGTPCYMAPEILKGESGYTEKADIWSIGITALELATGTPPFYSKDQLKTVKMIVESPPPSPPPNASLLFKSFIKSCLNAKPENRPDAKTLMDHRFFKKLAPIESLKQILSQVPDISVTPTRVRKRKQRAPSFSTVEWDFTPVETREEKLEREIQELKGRAKVLIEKNTALKHRISALSNVFVCKSK